MNKSVVLLLFSLVFACSGQDIPQKDWQLKTAVLAAPEEYRENATILGYDKSGQVVMLRQGSNDMVCLGDNPTQDGFSASAYHKDLEPYMQRGRELRSQGKNFQQIFETRDKEVREGKLNIPNGSTLFVLTGTYDMENDTLTESYVRSVVYIPFATAESTGLPLKEMAPGAPWIMDPGTHRAHIMINPPRKN